MCHINVIINKSKKNSKALINCSEVMGYLSSLHNKDGAGYMARLSDGRVIYNKSAAAIKIPQGVEYDIIATHQRLSTSGHTEENIHPYLRDGFLLMHNGIFNSLGDKDKSDTAYYADALQDAYNHTGDIVKAIKETHSKISGYYSIVLYEKKHKRFIYYKNSAASMNAIETDGLLIMSTSADNIKFAQWSLALKADAVTEIKFKPCIIYDLHTLQEIGEIEDKQYTRSFITDDRDFREYYYYTTDKFGVVHKSVRNLSKKEKKEAKKLEKATKDSGDWWADYQGSKTTRADWDTED